MNDSLKIPTSFKVISIIALLWNILGGLIFFGEYAAYTNEEVRALLPENQQALYDTVPSWLYVLFAVAVLTGIVGCIGLVMKKSWCIPILLLSMICVIFQHGYYMLMTNSVEVMGPTSLIMPIIVIIISIYLYFYSKQSKSKGWLS